MYVKAKRLSGCIFKEWMISSLLYEWTWTLKSSCRCQSNKLGTRGLTLEISSLITLSCSTAQHRHSIHFSTKIRFYNTDHWAAGGSRCRRQRNRLENRCWSAAGHPIHGSIIFQPQSFGISLVRALGRSAASKIRARAAKVSSSKARAWIWGSSFV